MIKLKTIYSATFSVTLTLSLGSASGVLAQSSSSSSNDFFGSSLPGTQQVPPNGATPAAGSPSAGPGSGLVPAPTGNGASPTDFTQDEKRMQKKTKAMAVHIKDLIAKGDKMMKDGKAHHDDKMFKKGKILKEIGEKQQAQLRDSAEQALAAKKEKEKPDGT